MRYLLSLLCLVLAGCGGRPLTGPEGAFVRAAFAEQLDVSRVRIGDHLATGSFTFMRKPRPRVSCSERIWPAPPPGKVTTSTGAMAIFHRVAFREDLYRPNFLPPAPAPIDLPDAMIFAHEMTHVWQWQQRARTRYHPLRGLSEHTVSDDPYLYDLNTTARFLDFGYEQQGAIVEEYICCLALDPEAPRTARLGKMIGAEFPIARLAALLDGRKIRLPWNGVETKNICDPERPE